MARKSMQFSLVLALLLLGSCAVSDVSEPFQDRGRVWPAAPLEARVSFVGEFSDMVDLGIGQSFWSRIVDATAGAADSRMIRPMAVAATSDGRIIFVADPEAECVHRYDLEARRYRCLRTEDKKGVRAVGLAVIDDERLVVSDSEQGMLFHAQLQDKALQPLYVSEKLEQPTGLFWNEHTERLFVVDTGRQSVLEFDRTGNFKQRIGDRGAAPGQFNYPTYAWGGHEGDLLVTDSLNFRLQRFDSDGRFLVAFGENGDYAGDFARPKGVATDQFGHVYVIDALMHSMQIFSRDGDLLLAIGEQGQGQGEFWLPNGIFITADNMIFVADSYNRRVQVFRYVGPEA